MTSFTGKVALVTGAGSGLGLATARAFAKAGASVVLADVDLPSAHAAAEKLKSEGSSALAMRCDVANEAQVKEMVEQTVAAFGRLDAAYNNAGVMSKPAALTEVTSSDWDRVVAVNQKGVWLCMKYEIQQMLKQSEGGAIVNCASIGGIVAYVGLAPYIASKHAVLGLTKCAALEYAKLNIRINAICPGFVHTPMIATLAGDQKLEDVEVLIAQSTPLGRMGRPEEIAEAVLWLCGPHASFLHGHGLVADGAFVVR